MTMHKKMFRQATCLNHARLVMSAMLIGLAPGTAAALTAIDFEDQTAPQTVTAHYGPQGVLFEAAYLDLDAAARSGTRVLRTYPLNSEIFAPVALRMIFTSGQSRVSMYAGSPFAPVNGTLRAFDSNGVLLVEDGPRAIAANVFTTLFEITRTTADIASVELHPETVSDLSIDDLEFDGDPPPPPPAEAPVVVITSPANGGELDADSIDISGTVTGEGLLSTAYLTITFRLPPESTAPPFRSDLSLTGTGTTRTFTLPGGFGGVPMGPIEIKVDAENIGGLEGSATNTITNLPTAIRQRVAAEPTLGEFEFGIVAGACKLAVYENGAVSVDSANTTYVFRGDIHAKWLTLRGAFDNEGFGCPLGEERDSPAVGGGRVQDFTDGRIYTTPNIGTFQVPAVFVDIIDKRGGEAATGVPIADPGSSIGAMRTWLFQKFTRPDRPDLLPSTIEIRGTPPRIWIARQSGDLSIVTTGTLCENFPCDGNLGPCSVEPTAPQPEPIENPGGLFCDGTTFFPGLSGPREWEPIVSFNGDYVSTPVYGAVVSSLMADTDLTLTHEWFYDCPPVPLRVPFDCPSDYLVKVKPYGPHLGIFPHTSLFAGTSRTSLKLEYERFYADFALWMGYPEIGDLMYAAGRWIIDCGHDTYKSELHPIFMYAKMKTVTSITDPFTGAVQENAFGGQPATRADIWVNGWYPGDPIEFDVFPPPRPSPDALLAVSKPKDADAAHGVSIEWSLQPPGGANHVHIRFTAPYRETTVTSYGEMIWEINRGYQGQWYLYWQE